MGEAKAKDVASVFNKISKGNISTITETEADSMGTLWHEITHNRCTALSSKKLNKIQEGFDELANEFTTRRTLHSLYEMLGVKEMPHPSMVYSGRHTAYEKSYQDYCYIIRRMGLKEEAVVRSVCDNHLTVMDDNQISVLAQGLLDGGLTFLPNAKGKAREIKLSDAEKLMKKMRMIDWSLGREERESVIDDWLKKHGYIMK